MVKVGNSLEKTYVVLAEDCISFLGSDVKPSLATPRMIMWMEITCREAVLPHLEAGQDTVGTKVNVEHLSATPVGDRVTYKAVVKEMDGRRLTFEVEARDEREVVGRGTHERFIIDVERFARGLKKKFGQV
jgi:predicted thioesterase